MSIFYALVAKNFDLILSEYTDYTGNFQQITRILLYKIKINTNINKYNLFNNKNIFRIQYDNYIYSYIIKDNLLFLCMQYDEERNFNNSQKNKYSLDAHSQNIIYAFLIDAKKFFSTLYTPQQIERFKSYELEEFDKTLHLLINYYNTKPKFTKSGLPIDNIMNEDIKIISDNINKFFNSDETLSITVVQNEAYNSEALAKKNIVLFSYNRRKEQIENIKTFSKIMGFIIGFILILYLLVTFFGNKENSSMNQNENEKQRNK
jgi:hypothetical protein